MVILFAVLVGAIAALLAAFLGGTVVYFCWPVVMVQVFHLPELTWWQAVCLTWICAILIKGSNTKSLDRED